LLHPRSCNALV